MINDWNVKSKTEAITCTKLIRNVKDIFMKETFIDLVEMSILPKINNAVKTWSPTSDIIPIHEWILPWVNVIGRSISDVFPGKVTT